MENANYSSKPKSRWVYFKQSKSLITYLMLLAAFAAGLLLGWEFRKQWSQKNQLGIIKNEIIRLNDSNKYKFINPLLGVNILEPAELKILDPLKKQLNDFVNTEINNGDASEISVYFRRQNTGRWIAINENLKYAPASLLKVPLMIAYFKLAESQPEILSQKVFYEGGYDNNQGEFFKPTIAIETGKSYTMEDLIRRMTLYSDNNATELLNQNIDSDLLKEVYTDLNLTYQPLNSNVVDFMTVNSYAYFFRTLYSATYLNNESSEKALNLLSRSDFQDGIVAGVPTGTTVSQKFGERDYTVNGVSISKELHDCGIVYYPQHPYLLCIMTKGHEWQKLASVISQISHQVYIWIDQHRDE